jgi:hypothetical protein
MQRAAAPVLACGAILLALLWARGDIPWIPIVSDTTGLAAVLFAAGLASEPALRGKQWTLWERFGYAAVISAALVALIGLGLQLAALPVTTANVLTGLLALSVVLGMLSLPYRRSLTRLLGSATARREVATGVASLVLLATAFGAILVLRPGPAQPALEAALVDDAGSMLALPLRVGLDVQAHLNVAIHSPSGTVSGASVNITGDGLQPWSAGSTLHAGSWSVVAVPLAPLRSGTIQATVQVRSPGTDLRLPIQIEIGP